MKALNSKTATKIVRRERIIQFGEGNFLRAFVDWIISNMNEKTDFDSSVVVVQPIENGMIDVLNSQDCLYHVNLQGLNNGEVINSFRMIDVISRGLNPYKDFDAFLALAEQPEMRFVMGMLSISFMEPLLASRVTTKHLLIEVYSMIIARENRAIFFQFCF